MGDELRLRVLGVEMYSEKQQRTQKWGSGFGARNLGYFRDYGIPLKFKTCV